MLQRLTGDADAGIGHIGEIRQRLLAGDVILTEDHLAISAVFGAPCTNPALQATTQPIPVMTGMTALHLFEHRDRPQAGMRLEQRADLAVPQSIKWIGTLASSNGAWLRRQMHIGLDATGRSLAEPSFGRSNTLMMVGTEMHEQSHLLTCDVSSGHFGPRLVVEEPIVPAHAAVRGREQMPASPVGLAYKGTATPT